MSTTEISLKADLLPPRGAFMLNGQLFTLPGFMGLHTVLSSDKIRFAFHPNRPPFNDSMTVDETASAMREEAENRVKAGVAVVEASHDSVEAKAGLLGEGFEVWTTNREEFLIIISKYCTSAEKGTRPVVTWIESAKGSNEPLYVIRAAEFFHQD